MRLIGSDGHGVELGVVGYQFPDAVDPRQRQSWLIVEGSAHCPQGTWSFRWQALTADDAVELARWLGRAAAHPSGSEHDGSGRLDFTEPNLAFAFTWTDPGLVQLGVSLDLEFSPPRRRQARSGEPFVVTSRLTAEAVLAAATEWAAEIRPYPLRSYEYRHYPPESSMFERCVSLAWCSGCRIYSGVMVYIPRHRVLVDALASLPSDQRERLQRSETRLIDYLDKKTRSDSTL